MIYKFFNCPPLSLRSAAETDFLDVVNLSRKAFADAEPIIGQPYTSIEDIQQRIEIGYEIYTVKNGQELIASVFVLPEDDEVENALFFGRLAVQEAWRGKGVGSAVVKAIISYAKDLNRKLVLLNFQQAHSSLQAYYERFGFKQVGELIVWKNLPIIPMRLEL
ncbi:MAG: GNAT family N-acetyltransferase [Bdellovibrionota bacterium]